MSMRSETRIYGFEDSMALYQDMLMLLVVLLGCIVTANQVEHHQHYSGKVKTDLKVPKLTLVGEAQHTRDL
jgi:hypothetical protein